MSKILVYGTVGLPDTYQEVQYLQSTGNQYIDTNYYMTAASSVETKLKVESGENRWCYGSSQDNNFYAVNILNNTNLEYRMVNSGWLAVPLGIDITYADHIISSDNTKLYLDGNELVTFTSTLITTSTLPLLIGARTPTTGTCFKGKWYYFKIWENNTLVRSLVPCYRKSDSVAGMYDLVSETFLTNSGSGTFTVGPDTAAKNYLEVASKVLVQGGGFGEYNIKTTTNEDGTQNLEITDATKFGVDKTVKFLDTNNDLWQICSVKTGNSVTAPSTNPTSSPLFIGWRDPEGQKIYFPYIPTDDIILTPKFAVLPSDTYQQVEYIESSGTQYIDTGVKDARDLKVEMEVSNISSSTSGASILSSGNSNYRWQIYHGTNYLTEGCYFLYRFYHNSSASCLLGSVTSFNDKHKIVFDLPNLTGSIDDGASTSIEVNQSGTINLNLYLFGRNESGTLVTPSTHRQHTLKIWKAGILVRNMIPCYRKSDSVVGMYDVINEEFLTNSGSGSFTPGPDVN